MQTRTKIQKRNEIKVSKELQALNALRENEDLADAIAVHLCSPHLSPERVNRLRATLAVLSHAPLSKKLLASL